MLFTNLWWKGFKLGRYYITATTAAPLNCSYWLVITFSTARHAMERIRIPEVRYFVLE